MSDNIDKPTRATRPQPESAFALVDASGLIDPMSVRRDKTTVGVYAKMRHLEEGDYRVIRVRIVSDE